MKTPIIGVTGAIDDEHFLTLFGTYTDAIIKAGGTPIVLAATTDSAVLDRYVSLCDGFLFSGGKDVDPRYYGEEKKEACGEIQAFRDEMELALLSRVLKTSKPLFCICRGAQVVNVVLGGTLYQDVPTEYKTEIAHRQEGGWFDLSHDVIVAKDSPLYALIGKERVRGNSFHHQAIKTLGKGLAVMATADDGIIEGVYGTGERYLRAFQWHPERLYDRDGDTRTIFSDFIAHCKEKTQ